SRRLDVGVNDADARPLGGQQRGNIGRSIGFACSASIGVNRNDLGHRLRWLLPELGLLTLSKQAHELHKLLLMWISCQTKTWLQQRVRIMEPLLFIRTTTNPTLLDKKVSLR